MCRATWGPPCTFVFFALLLFRSLPWSAHSVTARVSMRTTVSSPSVVQGGAPAEKRIVGAFWTQKMCLVTANVVSFMLTIMCKVETTLCIAPPPRPYAPVWLRSSYTPYARALPVAWRLASLKKALTCSTTRFRLSFWYRLSSTRPAKTSVGTTSKSRKNSVNSLAISANEFYTQTSRSFLSSPAREVKR